MDTSDDPTITAYKRAEIFVQTFYNVFDHSRHTASCFFREQSSFVWNGHFIDTLPTIQEFFTKGLPICNHEIISVDVQPFPTNIQYFLCVVSGRVAFEDNVPQTFIQTFILMEEPITQTAGLGGWDNNVFFVLRSTFRFIYHKSSVSDLGIEEHNFDEEEA